MSRYVVTGAKGGSTVGADAPNRLEIHDFVKNEAHFSLYIQALQKLQEKDQNIVDSFFQIGGIHGLPNVEWDDFPFSTKDVNITENPIKRNPNNGTATARMETSFS
ncbi:hypothetical protein PM082_020873 [Marasmius tenuissimus]|nr:hypothetical protein PM082_020873 [Marasmius tenuissimus]